MTEKMQRIAEMIRKTFTTEQEKNCFDGCMLYVNEHCIGMRDSCIKELDIKFESIDKKLDKIINIVGVNGNGES